MGVDYTTFLGPYIKVKNPPRNITEMFSCCINSRCKQFHKEVQSKFCEWCGHQIGQHTRPIEAPLNFDLHSIFNDRLMEALGEFRKDKNSMYLVSNLRKAPGLQFDPTEQDSFQQDLSDLQPLNQIADFKIVFKHEIEKLHHTFGEKNVTLHFGLLSWVW